MSIFVLSMLVLFLLCEYYFLLRQFSKNPIGRVYKSYKNHYLDNTLYELEVFYNKVHQEELVRNKLPPTKGKFSKILVGIDGSQPSMDAAEYALALAKKDNAELIAIHVLSGKLGYEHTPRPLVFGLPATPSSVNDIIQTSKQEAERWLERIKEQQQLDNENIIVKLKTEVILASTPTVAAELVDYARGENVDLIVVGTRGRSGIKKILLGSTASGIVTYAHCPVMIVK